MKYFSILMLLLALVFVGCKAKEDPAAMAGQAEPALQENADDLLQTVESTVEEQSVYVPGEWITDYQAALKYAQELGRPILMNFTGSDWCPWCFKLRDEVFVQKEFISYAKDNLVLVTVDFPKKKQLPKQEQMINDKLAEQYSVEGFPTIVLADHKGKEINRSGYQPGGAAAYVTHIKEMLKNK